MCACSMQVVESSQYSTDRQNCSPIHPSAQLGSHGQSGGSSDRLRISSWSWVAILTRFPRFESPVRWASGRPSPKRPTFWLSFPDPVVRSAMVPFRCCRCVTACVCSSLHSRLLVCRFPCLEVGYTISGIGSLARISQATVTSMPGPDSDATDRSDSQRADFSE